jgi:hypothetical protein
MINNNNNNNNTVLRYSDFELCLITCSEIVHKDLIKNRRLGRMVDVRQIKPSLFKVLSMLV